MEQLADGIVFPPTNPRYSFIASRAALFTDM
ncbi:hypothetical protein BOSE21B_10156 [Bosea sp. 21B]|nr:hypothetical protein BOSE21B_10156 [Bosea sp. 21B]